MNEIFYLCRNDCNIIKFYSEREWINEQEILSNEINNTNYVEPILYVNIKIKHH